MEQRLQLNVGFDSMRAAIQGGHDLSEAWAEVLDISTQSANPMPHVWGGAVACLIDCANALDEFGLLKETPISEPYNQILYAGHAARLASILAATKLDDKQPLADMVSTLVSAIGHHRDRLFFAGHGRLPKVLG